MTSARKLAGRQQQSRNTCHDLDGSRDVEDGICWAAVRTLARHVIEAAVEDATGRRWLPSVRRFTPKPTSKRHRERAKDFLRGRTRGPGRTGSMLDFCCALVGVNRDAIIKGEVCDAISERKGEDKAV